MAIPQRTNTAILGQLTHQVIELDKKAVGQKDVVETMARENGRIMKKWELEVVVKVCNKKMHQ